MHRHCLAFTACLVAGGAGSAGEDELNSPNVQIREGALRAFAARWQGPDPKMVNFFRRVMKEDPDPWLRGYALQTLHYRWVPIDPATLPTTFNGYHRGQLIDFQKAGLADGLIGEILQGECPGGYAAYVAGILKIRKAVPALGILADSTNEFVRYSAGRALIECGASKQAEPILQEIMNHPVAPAVSIGQIVDPHYQALAARAYAEIGPREKRIALQRLVALIGELENWQDINAAGRLQTAHLMLATLAGRQFSSHEAARRWLEAMK